MAALPYIQLYVADYLADTMHLSTEEHGAYLLLIFNYWQTGKPIPKNRLAKIARLTNERWFSVEDSLNEFFTDTGTEWVHQRIERDLDAIHACQNQRREAGKASAQARNGNKIRKAQRESNETATVVENSLNETSTNKDTDTDTDTDKTPSPAGEASAPEPVAESAPVAEPDPEPAPAPAKASKTKTAQQTEGFAEFWMAYPRKAAKADAEKAWRKLQPDRALQAEILASLAKQCGSQDWAKDNGKFIPHPATYLNGARWTDELAPAPLSRHHGFAQRDYTDGLIDNGDGTYGF